MHLAMIKDLSVELNVDLKAAGFWHNIIFLFKTDDEIRSLLNECAGKNRREIDKYVSMTRIEKIKKEKYSSVDEFIECFKCSQRTALERLFQESMDVSKLSKLKTYDPAHIYNIHSTMPFAVWFMSFVIYL